MIENFGVIPGGKPTDWVAGVNSEIKYEVRLPDGDWTKFCPPGEIQYSTRADFMDCVSRSGTNVIEIQEPLFGTQNNYSERFAAKRNGTTKNGNYMSAIPYQVMKEGLVLESSYPDTNGTWDEQYADIPQDKLNQLLAEGQEWLKKWKIQYEAIPVSKESFLYHLKHAPIHIAMYNPAHAVANILCPDDVVRYFDSYQPWIKDTHWQNVSFAQKIILTPNIMTNSLIVKNGTEWGIYDPATSEDGLITLMRNRGMEVPLTPENKLDWSKVVPSKTLI